MSVGSFLHMVPSPIAYFTIVPGVPTGTKRSLCTLLLSHFIVMMIGYWALLCCAVNYMISCTVMVRWFNLSKCLCCVLVCQSGWITIWVNARTDVTHGTYILQKEAIWTIFSAFSNSQIHCLSSLEFWGCQTNISRKCYYSYLILPEIDCLCHFQIYFTIIMISMSNVLQDKQIYFI